MQRIQLEEKDRRNDRDALHQRTEALEDKLESEKAEKENLMKKFSEVQSDLQKVTNNFENELKSKNKEMSEMKMELKKAISLIEDETNSEFSLIKK